MSTIANAAMVLGGAGLNTLWDYNRSNYMFDVPLMQSKSFQIQNLSMNRFALFREDVRDLAALTTDKVQSYLIVNTLKLGFIVSIFFSFDRSDEELSQQNFHEAQVDILVGGFFCCAFFWLLTSIWFSMHAVIVAQSLTTKFLLQVARLPAPDTEGARQLPSSSLHFERNLASTFRVPFVGRAAGAQGGAAERPSWAHAAECRSPGSLASMRSKRSMASARSASWASTASTTPFRPSDDDQDLEVAPWDIRLGRGCSAARRKQSALSICDILEGSGAGTQVRDPGDVHLKLLDMLRSNWSSFDLHGRISMVLGTVNLLIGIAFYSLYYFRSSLGHFYVQPSGWMCFATFSVLTWWCVLFELSLSSVKHALVAIAILVGPACLLLLDIASEPGGTRGEDNYSRNGVENYPWVFSVVSGLAAFWEIGLCWSGVTWKGRWPMHWRCSFFINPLYMEAGPMQHQADVCTYPSVEEGAAGDAGLAFAAVESAAPLVACIDAVLQSAPIAEPQVATARRARDGLQEMCRAAGLPSERTRPVEAFWLVAPGRQGKTCWIDPDPIEGGAPAPDAPKVSLVELLDAAQKAMHALQQDAKIWTERDMERLATSGGDPVVNPSRFAAQFQTEGSAAKHPMGRKASLMYTGGCVLTSLLWAVVFVYSCYAYAQESAAAPAAI